MTLYIEVKIYNLKYVFIFFLLTLIVEVELEFI